MERREFIRTALASAALIAGGRSLFSEQQCTDPVQTMTPMGLHPVEVCMAGIPSLSFTQAYQEMNEWCWAACISMVFEFYKHPVDQRRIVKETWGAVADMPGMPGSIMRDLNRKWKDDNGKEFACRGDISSVNLNTAIEDLKGGHPLIVGAMGHATVLTAMKAKVDTVTAQYVIQEVIVRDPWPGNGGRRQLTPREWASINFAARIRLENA